MHHVSAHRLFTAAAIVAAVIVSCFGHLAPAWAQDAKPVRVYILAGQSNMQGHAKVGLLERQIDAEETREMFAHLHEDGQWVVREDVWVRSGNRAGNLSVGWGAGPGAIGPELAFGHTMGDHYQDQQVLLIKTAWGGKSLARDFLPPSAMPSEQELDAMYEQTQEQAKQRNQDVPTRDQFVAQFGTNYRQMLEEVNDTLENLRERFPGYQGQGYKLAGFVWFHGWNDHLNAAFRAAYAENMAHFIRDVRRDLGSPKLPFVIGQFGVGGMAPNSNTVELKEAQAQAASLPEFQGNVKLVPTDVYWDTRADEVFRRGWQQNLEEWNRVGSDRPYHYLGSVIFFTRAGNAFAQGMIELEAQR